MILTTNEVAAKVGCHRSTVLLARKRLAERHGHCGETRGGIWVFSTADFLRLRKEIRKNPGNPNMTTGNDLWRGRTDIDRKFRKKRLDTIATR